MDKKELEHRLDRLCSTLVRCREARCYTCNKILRFADREAGHYIPREVKACRWNLRNVHTQCHRCNCYKGGNLLRYHELMIIRDKDAISQLDWCWELYRMGKLPEPTYDEKVALYNQLLQELRKNFPHRALVFAEWLAIE